MPAGAVCRCGELTAHPSRRCERCRGLERERASLRRRVYADPRWTQCRLAVFARDGWACRRCGHRDVGNLGRTLDAHHANDGGVLALLERGQSPFDPVDCETLCDSCHGSIRR